MTVCAYRLKTIIFSKIILNFSFKIGNITLDPDPNWAKILDPDPDPNSMYLDPQHLKWCNDKRFFLIILFTNTKQPNIRGAVLKNRCSLTKDWKKVKPVGEPFS